MAQRYQEGGPVTKPVKAALQTAGQYARLPDVLTPENAPQYGLDQSTGFIARGTPIAPATDPRAVAAPAQASPVPAPPPAPPAPTQPTPQAPPETSPPPGMAAGLGTPTGAPVSPPKEQPAPKEDNPAAAAAASGDKPVEQPKEDNPAAAAAAAGDKPVQAPKKEDNPAAAAAAAGDKPVQAPSEQTQAPSDKTEQKAAGAPDIGTLAGEQAYVTGEPVSGIQGAQPAPAHQQLSPQEALAQAKQQLTSQENNDADAFNTWDWSKGKPPARLEQAWNKRAAITKALLEPAREAQPPSSAAASSVETEPGTTDSKTNTISGTHTVFGLNYDGKTWDPQDNGQGFFTDNQGHNYNTRDPRVKVVAIPGDVLNATFGSFLQRHNDGSYTLIDSPEARKIYQAVESAHVEVKDAQGNIHKFPIGDVQGALAGHPGKVLDFSWGAAHEMGYTDNGHVDYQIVKGDGTPYPVPDLSTLPAYAGEKKSRQGAGLFFGGQPFVSVPVHEGHGGAQPSEGAPSYGPTSGGGGGRGEAAQPSGGPLSLALAAGAGALASRVMQGPAPEEEEPLPGMVQALINRGYTPAQAQAFAQSSQAITPGKGIGPLLPPAAPGAAQQPALPAPGAAPSAPGGGVAASQAGLADALKVLQTMGFKKGEAQGMLKTATGQTVEDLVKSALKAQQQAKGGAVPKPRPAVQAPAAQLPAPPVRPGQAPAALGAPTPPVTTGGLPPTPAERRGQIAAHAEQAIAEKRPMHISYISAPKEAARYPTRESRTIQYEEHSPEARLMGSTTGQLVGHSLIPVESRVTKEGEPYVLGLSTNVMANNHQHINEKLAAMGRNSPYPEFNQKFFNDVEGYLGNLNAGHTGTGQGIQVGTEEHPVSPDLSHVPHRLTRHEADFINLVLNNTKAMAQHKRDPVLAAQAQAVRELARAHGTLITEAGETNRMRHEINQSDPKWSQRVLEPSVRSFKSGLIHEVHPSEATLPETIRPGPEYQQMTSALHRAIQRGRPDIPIAASLHSNLQHNANINSIERAFSEGKITEEHAREALRTIGEDPDEYRYIQGSGGLITPYEENPEAITPDEHNTLKDNLRKQWISGKMDVENYRRKAAEVPLPEIASRSEAPTETVPQPKPPKPIKAAEPKPETETQEPSEETEPAEPISPPKKKPPVTPKPPAAEPELPPKAPTKPEEPSEEEAPEPTPGQPPEAPTGAQKAPKKKAKTPEQRAVEEQVRGEAATDRNDIGEGDQRKINRLQKLARGWIKVNAKLHDLSAHAHLTGQKNFKSNDLKKTEIGEHFDSTTEGGNPALDYNKPEHREHAATAILHDIMHALAGTKHALNKEGKPSSAFGWYDRAVRKTMRKMGQVAPEILTDPEHALAFKLALAVTSQGQDVHPNADSAWNIYRYWRQHGELPESRSVFGGGPKAEQMENNLAKLNDLWDKHGHHELQRMLMDRGTVKDLAQKYGLDFGTEKVGNTVNGAMFMGPKIGAFFSNLNGDFSPTTMDLWFSRTLNRLAGNMFKFRAGAMLNDRQVKGKLQKSHVNEMEDLLNKGQASGMTPEREAMIRKELDALRATPEPDLDRKKALEVAPELHNWAAERHKFYQKQNTINGVTRGYHPSLKTRENVLGKKLDLGVNELSDAPRNASERDNWRSIMTSVEGKLKDAGVKLTNADKQALLWFVEKNLFMHAGSPQKVAADYLDAAYMLGHKIKNGEMPGLDQPVQKVARRSRTLVAAAKPEEEFEEEEGEPVAKMRTGGRVQGDTDIVPAMLTPGEFVVNRNAVAAIGPQKLEALNQAVPDHPGRGYQQGGGVGVGYEGLGDEPLVNQAVNYVPQGTTYGSQPTPGWTAPGGPTGYGSQPSPPPVPPPAPGGQPTPEQLQDMPSAQAVQGVPRAQFVAPPRAQPVDTTPPPPPGQKPIFIKEGNVTNFASPSDIARYNRLRARGYSDKAATDAGGDSGFGAPELGYVNTANSYGVALPRDQLRALLGKDPAAFRTARLRMTINGQTFQVPISDYGPSDDQQKKGVVTDATYPLSQALGGFDMIKATNLGIVKNAGPDYKANPDAWHQEQAGLRDLLRYARFGEPAPTPNVAPPAPD